MKVAVLGSGNGGCGVAFDWAQHGHEVRLFDFETFPANVQAVAANGGIRRSGQLEGWVETAYAGHDIGRTLDGAELVFAVGPAYSTEATRCPTPCASPIQARSTSSSNCGPG